MKCLVFEPDVTGHRLQHVHHLTAALLDVGCDVSLALQTDCREHPEYRVHIKSLEPRFHLAARLDPRQGVSLIARRRRVAELIETIARVRPDWVYYPHADGVTQVAAVESSLRGNSAFNHVPIEAQIMRGKYGYPQRSVFESISSAANRWFTRRSPWRVTHVLDPFAMRGLEPLPDANSFRLIPEPVEPLPRVSRGEARRTLGVPEDGRYVSVVGGIHPRKGIDLLLAGFTRAKLEKDDRLLFVGTMAPEIRDLIARRFGDLQRQGRIATVDRYVTDHELHCGLLAADVVAVTYPRQVGSSGALVRAAVAKRPVLASDFGWIAWATETFQLGTTVDVSDVDRYADAIGRTLAHCDEYEHCVAAQRFCQYHTIANQKAHWLATLGRERNIHLGSFEQQIPWSSVMDAVGPSQHTVGPTTLDTPVTTSA